MFRSLLAQSRAFAVLASCALFLSAGLVQADGHGAKKAKADIVDTAVAAGSFETLVTAVKAAGLVDALKGEGPLTVFAPTDEAFAKLPAGTVESLLKPENVDQLKAVLLYHVVPGAIMAADVTDGAKPETLQGATVTAAVGDGVTINGARVVSADVAASNGVIHVIDTVLLPPTEG